MKMDTVFRRTAESFEHQVCYLGPAAPKCECHWLSSETQMSSLIKAEGKVNSKNFTENLTCCHSLTTPLASKQV